MTIAQANVTPVVQRDALDTVTLKNIVALDIVEQNEAMLGAFGLLDDTATRTTLPINTTTEQLTELIQKKKGELEVVDKEIDSLKAKSGDAYDTHSADAKAIEEMAKEFTSDELPQDNTDALIQQFEKENNVKLEVREFEVPFNFTTDEKLRAKYQTPSEATNDANGVSKTDADGDVVIA
ncbi:CYFA0S10e04632g1_1 [Cyberlindnera fabianii]|uniref:CYFA0S10e04632g1_1 n=1 Tax=Cyberlindnera fabianii TaxID=36022 RepID=A0A061AZE9_CYBFA|nr:CYFA0S10e04632g1_1 [Cyberlindnera fabianii]